MNKLILYIIGRLMRRPLLISILSIIYFSLTIEILIYIRQLKSLNYLIIAAIGLIIGYGLWYLKKWGRIAAIIFVEVA